MHPYRDLVIGRVDAVLLDNVLAERAMRRAGRAVTAAGRRGDRATTSACWRPANAALRDRVDAILRAAMRDGTLERIFRKWHVWNDDQPALFARVLGAARRCASRAAVSRRQPAPTADALAWRRRAATCRRCSARPVDHARAVVPRRWRWRSALGVAIASGRVYGGRLAARCC